jgi:hypothetical protein
MVGAELKHQAKYEEKKEKKGTEQRHTLRRSKWDLVGMVGAKLKHLAKSEEKKEKKKKKELNKGTHSEGVNEIW